MKPNADDFFIRSTKLQDDWGGGWEAYVTELGKCFCVGSGDSQEEAVESCRTFLKDYILDEAYDKYKDHIQEPKPFNIIFLDFDGVITFTDIEITDIDINDKYDYFNTIDDAKMLRLQLVNHECENVKIVIVSNWRHQFNLNTFTDFFDQYDIEVIDKTGRKISGEPRGHLISVWLAENQKYVNKFVILDDKNYYRDFEGLNKHWYDCSGEEMFSSEIMYDVIKYFNDRGIDEKD
ncbi:HAD domain-containing protein [uncultured Arcobacter sp.]|uniref:HAD domain-containing protein n=1 Tax=uncultured Arcobacter sp. TaxID=165434 RepID=UPI00260D3507|nr:HAD domain-containing protein [uncultured Arcobacter sp.]